MKISGRSPQSPNSAPWRSGITLAAQLAVAAGVSVGAVVAARAWIFGPAERARVDPLTDPLDDAATQVAADHLSELVRIPTVSFPQPEQEDAAAFEEFRRSLRRLYPLTFGQLAVEDVNSRALLLHWPAKDPTGAAQGRGAVVLMAHWDVVPAEQADEWTYPPFSGTQADGYIWGRGTLDDKGDLVSILEATESLLAQGFAPAQDVYLSFGDNEETAGLSAARAAELLAERGVTPWLVLDEGGAVATGAFPGVKIPAAVVGVAEKGILDVEISTNEPGGHASTPPRLGATARLARALLRIERHPFPQHLPGATRAMVEEFGRHSAPAARAVLANLWLFGGPLTRVFGWLGGETNAMTRTTVALTQLRGSAGANVLAAQATAHANIRVAVGETVEQTVRRLRRIIRDDRVSVTVVSASEPSPVSATDNAQFAALTAAVGAVFPDAIVVPYIMMAATDSRRFTGICPAVYRFAPLLMTAQDRASLHGVNERVSIAALAEGVRFYNEFLQRLNTL